MLNLSKGLILKNSIQYLYRFKAIRTQAGQGLIEYLLILILTVSIIFGVMRGVGSPLVNYIQNNVFGLVGCMLRVGEGPQRAFDLCGGTAALEFNLGELTDNNPTGGNSGSTGGSSSSANSSSDGGGNNSNNSNNASNSDSTASINEPSGRSSVDGDNNGGGGAGGGYNSSEFGSNSSNNGANRIKISSDEAGEDGSFDFKGGGSQTTVVRRVRRSGEQIGGGFTLVGREEAINSSEFQQNTPSPSKKKIPTDMNERKRKVSSFSVDEKKGTGAKIDDYDPGSGFSFIKMLKWALIIAILVIFVLFTLSQLNSIRKGWTD